MIIRFSYRVAVSACSLCVAGLLALTPAAAASRHSAGEPAPPPPRAAMPGPSLLYRSGIQVRAHHGVPEVPDVSALSWLIADAGNGEVLAADGAHRKLPPASTLKTLFALTVLPALPREQRHTVRYEELEDVGEGSSLVGVEEGHSYRVEDLWRGVFLSSGNDAVHVLASLGGGLETTVARMQNKARSLGALDTHVVSPDGYDRPGQVSSAFDLAVFGRAGLRNPDFARYCRTAQSRFPGDGSSYPIENTNRLLTGEDGVMPYPGLIGIKNGYTTNAGNTLVAAARRGGRTLVATVMNPQEGGGFTVYEEARALLDWGFSAAGRVDPVGSLDALRAKPHATAAAAAAPVVAAASRTPDEDSGWSGTAVVLGLSGLGAGAVVLALRARGGRSSRS
ncbi:D-alanyl-D-alanine carboxypeptidase [Streptomyces pluripotens]|uniref:D-alanyl-D-alanine carboxypeptidase n=1 Tax=Streptomyces pluripotens TaxID=1355015 RepID=A0A221P696_9ACTN|nr:serine hydrolase [Streptomyces pluripotens]ARP73539.1 D-alanyl-D-alanine carboxypeptidase [Streptomyces pluripotens]ASN27789.1 D-alanyl-D-alanine carboxypeptidase [Streptomyces pluripotens]